MLLNSHPYCTSQTVIREFRRQLLECHRTAVYRLRGLVYAALVDVLTRVSNYFADISECIRRLTAADPQYCRPTFSSAKLCAVAILSSLFVNSFRLGFRYGY